MEVLKMYLNEIIRQDRVYNTLSYERQHEKSYYNLKKNKTLKINSWKVFLSSNKLLVKAFQICKQMRIFYSPQNFESVFYMSIFVCNIAIVNPVW